jgi:hypothetical protein
MGVPTSGDTWGDNLAMSRRVEEMSVWAVTSDKTSSGAIGLYDVTVTITIPAESIGEAVAALVDAVGELA